MRKRYHNSDQNGKIECDKGTAIVKLIDVAWLTMDELSPYIEVADTGCGMDTETIGKIFDPFFTTKFTGRGLGMSAVLGIVMGHKGAIKIFIDLEQGTTFTILFPANEPSGNRLADNLNDEVDWKEWRGSGTVLIVDDEETVCAVGEQMLDHMGFSVLTASDGLEALKLFHKHNEEIVCVLLDLTMPHMNGVEPCARCDASTQALR